MDGYDIFMLVVVAATAVFGAMKGFAWQVASIGSIIISYFVAYRFREPFSQSIRAEPPWNGFLAMLILYVGTSLLIWLGFRMVSKTIDRMRLQEFDRHVGAVFGVLKGCLYCTLITLFAVTLLGPESRQKIVHSRSGYFISKALTQAHGVMPEEVQQVIGPYLDRLDHGATEPREQENGLWNNAPWNTAADTHEPWVPANPLQHAMQPWEETQRR